MAATFIFLSALRTNTPSCIDRAMATLISASRAEMKEWRDQRKDRQKKNKKIKKSQDRVKDYLWKRKKMKATEMEGKMRQRV